MIEGIESVEVDLMYADTQVTFYTGGENNGVFTVSLAPDQTSDLAARLRDAALNQLGVERISVAWRDTQADDIIESLGVTLKDTPHVLPDSDLMRAYFGAPFGSRIDLPGNMEVSVNRRIQ